MFNDNATFISKNEGTIKHTAKFFIDLIFFFSNMSLIFFYSVSLCGILTFNFLPTLQECRVISREEIHCPTPCLDPESNPTSNLILSRRRRRRHAVTMETINKVIQRLQENRESLWRHRRFTERQRRSVPTFDLKTDIRLQVCREICYPTNFISVCVCLSQYKRDISRKNGTDRQTYTQTYR